MLVDRKPQASGKQAFEPTESQAEALRFLYRGTFTTLQITEQQGRSITLAANQLARTTELVERIDDPNKPISYFQITEKGIRYVVDVLGISKS